MKNVLRFQVRLFLSCGILFALSIIFVHDVSIVIVAEGELSGGKKVAEPKVDISRSIFCDFTPYINTRDHGKIELKDGLDLSGKNLAGVSINRHNEILKNINFAESSLRGTNLSETIFFNCSFKGTNLCYSIAINSTTDMNGGMGEDFPGCDFTDANIEGSNFVLNREQFFSTWNFRNKSLPNTKHINVDLSNSSLADFDLQNSSIGGYPVKNCDFSDAMIEGACLTGSYNYLTGESPKEYSGVTKEQLYQTKDYKYACLLKVRFRAFDFSDADLSKINMTGCKFSECNFAKADFTDAVISGCDLSFRIKDLTLEQIKSTWNYKNGRMAGIILPEEIQAALDAEKEGGGK